MLLSSAFAQNRADYRMGSTSNWTSHVVQFIQMLRPGFSLSDAVPLAVGEHIRLYKSCLWAMPSSLAADSSRVRLHTYYRWFKPPASYDLMVHLPPTVRFSDLSMLMRFRSGCHDLRVEKGRWDGTPRQCRLCSLCGHDIQDEYHIVFQCTALHDVRCRFQQLFRHATMHAFFNYNRTGPLIAFLKECLTRAAITDHP